MLAVKSGVGSCKIARRALYKHADIASCVGEAPTIVVVLMATSVPGLSSLSTHCRTLYAQISSREGRILQLLYIVMIDHLTNGNYSRKSFWKRSCSSTYNIFQELSLLYHVQLARIPFPIIHLCASCYTHSAQEKSFL